MHFKVVLSLLLSGLLLGVAQSASSQTPPAATVTLSSDINPSWAGQQITFYASVSGNSPTGTVSFLQSANFPVTCDLNPIVKGSVQPLVGGVATCSRSGFDYLNSYGFLAGGQHTNGVYARYDGDANNSLSLSPIYNQVVNVAQANVTVTSSANPAWGGQVAHLTAGVTGAPPPFSPTGTVSFFVNGSYPIGCSAVSMVNGLATCDVLADTNNIALGDNLISARNSDDASNSQATGTIHQVFQQATPLITTISSVNPAYGTQTATLTTRVVGALSPFVPTGTVSFFVNGSYPIGCSALALVDDGSGGRIATCNVATFFNNIGIGANAITVNYSGDASNKQVYGAGAITQTFLAATTPGAPTGAMATAGNANAAISFSAPTNNGGATITSYTATANPGGITATGSTSPINLSGLTNGTPYTFTVTAKNSIGFSMPSVPSNSVIPATTPGVPTSVSATAGNAQATVTYSPPVSDGGSAITSYTVVTLINHVAIQSINCSAPCTQMVVFGLTNGTAYTFVVVATNGLGPGSPSAESNSVTPLVPAPISLTAVQSRKTHGATGSFDLAIDTSVAIGGAVTVEPRTIGSSHTIVFQFSGPVSSVGGVNSQDANSSPLGTATFSGVPGTEITVTLTNIPDNRRATVTLTTINGDVTNNPSAVLGFLVGDVNSTRSVNSSDISGVKARSGQSTTALNFRFDVNASGAIDSSDISAVKARSGLVLP